MNEQRFKLWALRDYQGSIWRYTNGKPVFYNHRYEADSVRRGLNPMPRWRVVSATVVVQP